MLKESQVIRAVCQELRKRGYVILQQLGPSQRGDDIIAWKARSAWREEFVIIEAKGGTSSNQNSRRYNKPFSSAQERDHVAVAVFKALTVISGMPKGADVEVAIALPDTLGHRRCVNSVKTVLRGLHVAIFWVQESPSKVRVERA